jgi:hypothetical protein
VNGGHLSALSAIRRGSSSPVSKNKKVEEAVQHNPKTQPTDNAEKDPQDWATGEEPMTGAQASYLKTLCE